MDDETGDNREGPGPADKAFLRNLIIAKAVVLLAVLAVVGLVFLLM